MVGGDGRSVSFGLRRRIGEFRRVLVVSATQMVIYVLNGHDFSAVPKEAQNELGFSVCVRTGSER